VAAIITTTVSPVLAALFVASDAAQAAQETHQRDVLDVPAPASMSEAERSQQCEDNNALSAVWADSHYAIAGFPAETMTDLKTKLSFMVKEKLGEGQDWLPTILEDLERIEPAETPERVEALRHYEQATLDNLAALAALNVAEEAHNEDPHVEASRAYIWAEAKHDEASTAQCAAIRALILPPAPSLSALLVNMQIAIDTGMIACTDLNDALKTDLRRFSNYADKEA
jgi:hypothetical protein